MSALFLLDRLRVIPILPPDGESKGGGEGYPSEVREEDKSRRLVNGIELESAGRHVHPESRNLQRGQLEVMASEEYRGPGPVEGELRGVEAEGSGVGPRLVHEKAGVTHPGVERSPDRTESPVGRTPSWPVQVLVPSLDVVPGNDGTGNGSGKRKECTDNAFKCHLK